MPFNKTCTITCVRNTKIKWKQTELTNLGLNIISSIYQTRDMNLTQTYDKIRANIDHWSSLPISLWVRVNMVKMNILPTVNYILRMLPSIIQKVWFDDLHKAFIWHGKKAWCSYLRMSNPYKKGGLQLPNFFHYYSSFGCQQVNMFFDSGVIKDWKTIEENMLQSLNIDSGCLYYMKRFPKVLIWTPIEVSFNILKSCAKVLRIDTDIFNKSANIAKPKYNGEQKGYLLEKVKGKWSNCSLSHFL